MQFFFVWLLEVRVSHSQVFMSIYLFCNWKRSDRIGYCSGNVSDLHYAGTRFTSWTRHRLSWLGGSWFLLLPPKY